MNFILIAIVLAILMIIFWIIMIFIVKRKDIKIEVQEEGKNRIIPKWGKFIMEGQPKSKKIKIHDKSKDHITYWEEYFEYIEGEKKPRLRLFKDINGLYHPRKSFYNPDLEDIQEKIDQKDMLFWHTLEVREGDEKYKQRKKFMETAASIIGMIIAGMVFFFSMYYASDIANKTMGHVTAYELKTLDLRAKETDVLNITTRVLERITPILEKIEKENRNQFVGVVNG